MSESNQTPDPATYQHLLSPTERAKGKTLPLYEIRRRGRIYDEPGYAWYVNAYELGRWSWHRLMARSDCFGKYYWAKDEDGKDEVRSCTEKCDLTERDVVAHFEGRDLIGYHMLNQDQEGPCVALDIDFHQDGEDDGRNKRFAVAVYGKLVALGFRPLLYTSNDTGGYHLRILFSRFVSRDVIQAFLNWLKKDCEEYGIPDVEIFPKSIRDCPIGNFLRLPGRYKKPDQYGRYWYSEVYDGERWLYEQEAVDHILSLTGDDPALIPDEAKPAPEPFEATEASQVSRPASWLASGLNGGGDLDRRIRGLIAKVGPKATGGRDNAAHYITSALRNEFGCSPAETLRWLIEWNSAN